MIINYVPNLLKEKEKTPYWLWQELGGGEAAKSFVYKVLKRPYLPDRTSLVKMIQVADVFECSLDDLIGRS